MAAIEVGSTQIGPADYSVLSSTSIAAVIPPARDARPPNAPAPQDGAGPADIVVTLTDNQSSMPGPDSVYQYVDTSGTSSVPSITGVVPYGGAESAPAKVTILGSGFTKATTVEIRWGSGHELHGRQPLRDFCCSPGLFLEDRLLSPP